MNEWNIQSRAHHCQACEVKFADKQPYHTLLFDEKHGFRRLDVCEPCWTKSYGAGQATELNFASYWQGVYEAPPPPVGDAFQKESAETLLRKLLEVGDEKYVPACFILAAMLERKRMIKLRENLQQDGKKISIYEQPKTGDLFSIVDPLLQLNQLDKVQRDVADLLEFGLAGKPPGLTETAVAEPSEKPTEQSNKEVDSPAAGA